MYLTKCPVLVGLFCAGNFRDIFVNFQGYRVLRKFKRIFSNLLKGIWDNSLFTSRDIGYWYPPIQASKISYKFFRISDTQFCVFAKVYDLLGQPS